MPEAPQAQKAWEWFKSIGSPKYHVAPMVDQSELPFRMLCRENGATCAYTPMFHSRLFVQDSKYRREQWSSCEGDRPLFAQFCANDPEWLIKAALIVAPPAPGYTPAVAGETGSERDKAGEVGVLIPAKNDSVSASSCSAKKPISSLAAASDCPCDDSSFVSESSSLHCHASNGNVSSSSTTPIHPPTAAPATTYKLNTPPPPTAPLCDAIDLNLGCPQRIAKRGRYGAFLMDDLPLIEQLVRGLVQAVAVPVTVKIRIFPEVERTLAYAKMLESAGASLLAVHGRTREMKDASMHLPDWEQIKAVRQALSIPVLGNGGVRHLGEAEALMNYTGVQGVLSAEPLLVDPGLFANRRFGCQGKVPALEAIEMAARYLELAKTHRVHTRMVRGHVHRILAPWLAEYTGIRNRVNVGRNSIEDFALAVDELKTLVAASGRVEPRPVSKEAAEAANRQEREEARRVAIEEQEREAHALQGLEGGGGGEEQAGEATGKGEGEGGEKEQAKKKGRMEEGRE